MSREPELTIAKDTGQQVVSQLAAMWLEELEACFDECYGSEKKPVEDMWAVCPSEWIFWECYAEKSNIMIF